MKDYVILTDSSCDLPAELAEELGLKVVPLSVMVDEKQYTNYLDEREISAKDFYSLLRSGKTASTSAANMSDFTAVIEPIIAEGKDVIYLGFSSGLSATYNAGKLAADELQAKYPEAKIFTVDTLCASLGQGLLVFLAVQEKRKGKTIEQVRDFVESTKLHLCHWFTVDDLNHLKRGGRLSSTTALVGTVLDIKPVLHVDNDGHLVSVEKVRGRKTALKKLVQHMRENALSPCEQTIFISHGDCEGDAKQLSDLIREQMGVKTFVMNPVGPVIGAHAGPGTLALFFTGKAR